jgi:hypothetical protein
MWGRLGNFWRRLVGLRGRPAPDGDGQAPVWTERRQGVRYASTATIFWRPADAAQQVRLPAQVQDVSFAGIRFVLDQPFEPGTLLAVCLPATSGGPGVALLGCVRHRAAHEHKGWTVGCSFIRDLSEKELNSLL